MALGKSYRPQSNTTDWYEILVGWAATLFKLALAAFVVAYGYYMWAVLGGYLRQAVTPRIISNLNLMGNILIGASIVGTICLCLMTLDEVAWAVLAGIVGAFVAFGTPRIIASSGAQSQAVQIVLRHSVNAGIAIIAVVAVRVLWEIWLYIATGPKRTKEEREIEEEKAKLKKPGAVTARFWARCWEMPYCHESVREQCPAYKARKTCWKYGFGCMCHPRLIEAVIMASTKGAKTAQERAIKAGYVRSDLAADVKLSKEERTIPCSKCPIYIEHQRQKFRIVNPIAIVATLGGLALAYKPMMGLYRAFVQMLSNLAARFTLTDHVNPAEWFSYLDTPTVRIFFFIIVGTLILAYVLKAIEWLIIVKKVL